MSDRGRHPEWRGLAREYEWSRIRDRFSIVLVLLIITVFFSISAPNTRWAWLATTVALAASLMVAMVASGAHPKVVRSGLTLAGIGLAQSIVIVLTQAQGDARMYLSLTSLVLTLLAMGAIARRLALHAEISVLTVMGAVCLYVLLGLGVLFHLAGGRDAQRLRVLQLRHDGHGGLRRPHCPRRRRASPGGD